MHLKLQTLTTIYDNKVKKQRNVLTLSTAYIHFVFLGMVGEKGLIGALLILKFVAGGVDLGSDLISMNVHACVCAYTTIVSVSCHQNQTS